MSAPGDLEIRGYVVAQPPNAPLRAALAGILLARLGRGDGVRAAGRSLMWAGLAVWAWLEASEGVNGLRRALGIAGLGLIAAGIGRELRRTDPGCV